MPSKIALPDTPPFGECSAVRAPHDVSPHRTVLAALSGSSSQVGVLAYAQLFASAFGTSPCALHVAEPLRSDPAREIVRAARHPDVRLVVVGTHTPPNGRGPGFTTLDIAARVNRPLLVVPPDADLPAAINRVLVPLEGTSRTTTPIRGLFEQLPFGPSNVVAVHTFVNDDVSDTNRQPEETDEWVSAFRRSYAPNDLAGEIIVRSGPPQRVIPEVAATLGADLTILSWSQCLEPGRAQLVKTLLSDRRRPTLLVPAIRQPQPGGAAPGWSNHAGSRLVTAAR